VRERDLVNNTAEKDYRETGWVKAGERRKYRLVNIQEEYLREI
jgi:hypothetical protein